MLILATEAGANGDATKQKGYLDRLIAAYPSDERAHFNIGGYYFGQQDFTAAIEHYRKATELAPSYSPAYNILGYAYRQKGDYANAEQAFKKYIELIPKDPNLYDSYAELLLKMGRFQDSLAQYAKALAIDSNFLASHLGRAADFMYMGKTGEATSELDMITKKARSDGDRRTALFGRTVLAVDRGKWDEALAAMDQQYAIAEQAKDAAAMAGDLQTKGQILLEMAKYDDARAAFDQSLKVTEGSSLSERHQEKRAAVRALQQRKDRTRPERPGGGADGTAGVSLGGRDIAQSCPSSVRRTNWPASWRCRRKSRKRRFRSSNRRATRTPTTSIASVWRIRRRVTPPRRGSGAARPRGSTRCRS